jgi:hypothetical protein
MNGTFARNLSGIDGQHGVADRELNQLPIFSCSPLVQTNYLYPSNAYVFASDDRCALPLRELACTREGRHHSGTGKNQLPGTGQLGVRRSSLERRWKRLKPQTEY